MGIIATESNIWEGWEGKVVLMDSLEKLEC